MNKTLKLLAQHIKKVSLDNSKLDIDINLENFKLKKVKGEKIPNYITNRSEYAKVRGKDLYRNVKIAGIKNGWLQFEPDGDPILINKL